jgi:uncharacterized phage protein (TIGR01671 family)
MNRVIKFRGKRVDNGEWVEGSYVCLSTHTDSFTPYDAIFTLHGDNTFESIEVDPSTVGQFTGLCDKNGKEIFEGDMLSYEDDPSHVVKWNNDFCCWTCWEDSNLNNEGEVFDWSQMKKQDSKHYTIHDNPEETQ